MTSHHVFLTRFNLPSEGNESLIRAKEGWLKDRIALFERYTVPSVRSQTARSAAWLVYLDTESPSWLLDKMHGLADEGLLTLLLRTSVPASDLREDIARVVRGTSADTLITTNLDNDDGLSREFVARLFEVSISQVRMAVYLTDGLIRTDDQLYLRRDRHNAFCSVIEPLDDPVTCWADWHNRLHLHLPVLEVCGAPAWLQVIHTANVSNRVRGRLTSPAIYADTFDDLITDLPLPSSLSLAKDRLVMAPGRAVREGVRASGKQLILRFSGKDGLDRVKQAMTGRRSA